jgi:ASC-1-like (ASCH) protein
MKTHILKLRSTDKEIFEAIKSDRKKVETRAATVRNVKIQEGDEILFVCGKQSLKKKVRRAKKFKTIKAMLKDYRVKDIAPDLKTENELRDMYFAWPSYRDKIKEFGIIAFEFD